MEVTVEDLARTGPGTIAGRYMRSFWQPVFRGEDLQPGRTAPIRIMGEDFTLYRSASGTPHVVAPRCAHRLTRLHTGWVQGETLRCRYHGWTYDGTGQCIFQPGELEGFTQKTHIAAYPTAEYIGLIWAYFGEGPAPPMRRIPDFERPGLISLAPPEVWPCNYFNRLDNAPDGMHVLFTHADTTKREGGIGSGVDGGQFPTQDFAETECGLESRISFGGITGVLYLLMPNATLIAPSTGKLEGPRNGPRAWRAELHFRVPVDDEHSISFPVYFIDLHGEDAARYVELRDRTRAELGGDPARVINAMAEAVLAGRATLAEMDPQLGASYTFPIEDYVTMVGQGAIVDRTKERLGQIDQGTVMLRRLWLRELQAVADGKPTTPWTIPEGLVDRTEPQPSWAARATAGSR